MTDWRPLQSMNLQTLMMTTVNYVAIECRGSKKQMYAKRSVNPRHVGLLSSQVSLHLFTQDSLLFQNGKQISNIGWSVSSGLFRSHFSRGKD